MGTPKLRLLSRSRQETITDNGQVPAVSRALAILRLLGKSEAPMGVNEIARALDLVPSTVLHILRVLAAHEMVAPDASKKYQLDAGVLTLARSLFRPRSFGPSLQPYLNELSERFNVLAVGSRVIGLDHYVIVATSRPRGLHLHIDIGTRIPALLSATGQCVAAFSPHSKVRLRQAFKRLKWRGAPSFEQWMNDVERARGRRYGVDQRYIKGMTTVAAPIVNASGTITHAVAVVGLSEGLTRFGTSRIGNELRRVAETMSRGLPDSG